MTVATFRATFDKFGLLSIALLLQIIAVREVREQWLKLLNAKISPAK